MWLLTCTHAAERIFVDSLGKDMGLRKTRWPTGKNLEKWWGRSKNLKALGWKKAIG